MRLDVFTPAFVDKVASKIGAIPAEEMPYLKGCLGILCTSRSGSTYLCREIERRYTFHRLGESLNPPRINAVQQQFGWVNASQAVAKIVADESEDGWYGFKGGAPALVCSELTGLLPRNIEHTSFLLLFRRDAVAQAVSLVKAEQTSYWHSTQPPEGSSPDPVYNYDAIVRSVRWIVRGSQDLIDYVARTERPHRRVFYEDFANGDLSGVEAACDDLGLPKRPKTLDIPERAVSRIGDAVNESWADAFRRDLKPEHGRFLERYGDLL